MSTKIRRVRASALPSNPRPDTLYEVAGELYLGGTKVSGSPSGGSGSVAVQDEGTQVAAGAARLNFRGAGVTASSDGAGGVNVDIPGYSAFPPDSFVSIGQQNVYALLPATAAALAAVKAGTGRMRVLRIGDSTEWGAYAVATAAGNRPYSVGVAFSRVLRELGVPSWANSWLGDGGVTGLSSTLGAYDTRITLGTGWATNASVSTIGGRSISSSTASTSVTFQPRSPCDTFVVFYIRQTNSAGFTLSRAGDASLPVANSGSNALMLATFSGARGMAPLSIEHDATTNALNIVGVIAFDSTTPAVDVIQACVQGSKVGDWANATNPWGFRNCIDEVAPHLTIISPGINDWANGTTIGNSSTAGTFIGDLHTLVTTCRAFGDVMIVPGFPSWHASAARETQKSYVDALAAYCAAQNILYQDLWTRMGPAEDQMALYANGLHPVAAGYAKKGDAEARIIASIY